MMKFNLHNNPSKNFRTCRGFTLLEALVAISILMVAVVSPITIAQKGLSSASYSKNQMIASYLAQDAIEYIKNKRDENVINGNDWLAGFDDECTGVKSCSIDTKYNAGAGQIYDDEMVVLKKEKDIDGNFEFYGYEGTEDTNFYRTINITPTNLGDEALVTVEVGWGTDSITVQTLIYNI